MSILTGALLAMPGFALLLAAWAFQRPALRAWFSRPGLGTTGP